MCLQSAEFSAAPTVISRVKEVSVVDKKQLKCLDWWRLSWHLIQKQMFKSETRAFYYDIFLFPCFRIIPLSTYGWCICTIFEGERSQNDCFCWLKRGLRLLASWGQFSLSAPIHPISTILLNPSHLVWNSALATSSPTEWTSFYELSHGEGPISPNSFFSLFRE